MILRCQLLQFNYLQIFLVLYERLHLGFCEKQKITVRIISY